MKTAQVIFDWKMGFEPTDEQFNQIYRENKELLALIESRPKKEFTLRKPGKEDRKVMARCAAEIEANPVNKGWEIVPQSVIEVVRAMFARVE